MKPNRVAVYLTGLGNLVAGLLPVLDILPVNGTEEIVPYVTSLGLVNGVVITWLINWGKWERQHPEYFVPKPVRRKS